MKIRSEKEALEVLEKLITFIDKDTKGDHHSVELNDTLRFQLKSEINSIKAQNGPDTCLKMTVALIGHVINVFTYEQGHHDIAIYPLTRKECWDRYQLALEQLEYAPGTTSITYLGDAVLKGKLPFNEELLNKKIRPYGYSYNPITFFFPTLTQYAKEFMALIDYCRIQGLDERLIQSVIKDHQDGTLSPFPVATSKVIAQIPEDLHVVLIHQLEQRNNPFAYFACALLLCKGDIANLDGQYTSDKAADRASDEAFNEQCEKRTHDLLDFLNKAAADPKLKPAGESLLYLLRDVTPYPSVYKRLEHLPLAYAQQCISTLGTYKTKRCIPEELPDILKSDYAPFFKSGSTEKNAGEKNTADYSNQI